MSNQLYEDLKKALDILIEDGWIKGQYEDDRGRVCLAGALKKAVFGSTRCSENDTEKVRRIVEARTAVHDYLRGQSENTSPHLTITSWNDDSRRTYTEVLGVVAATAGSCRTHE